MIAATETKLPRLLMQLPGPKAKHVHIHRLPPMRFNAHIRLPLNVSPRKHAPLAQRKYFQFNCYPGDTREGGSVPRQWVTLGRTYPR